MESPEESGMLELYPRALRNGRRRRRMPGISTRGDVMSKLCWLVLGLGLTLTTIATAQEPAHRAPDPVLVERARKLLDAVPLIDGHNDLPWEYRNRVKNHLEKI